MGGTLIGIFLLLRSFIEQVQCFVRNTLSRIIFAISPFDIALQITKATPGGAICDVSFRESLFSSLAAIPGLRIISSVIPGETNFTPEETIYLRLVLRFARKSIT